MQPNRKETAAKTRSEGRPEKSGKSRDGTTLSRKGDVEWSTVRLFQPCEECGQEVKVTGHCAHCGQTLCENCRSVHAASVFDDLKELKLLTANKTKRANERRLVPNTRHLGLC